MTIEEMKRPVATHEQVAQRLKELSEGPQDVSKLPVVYHRALDLNLHVGPMSGNEFQGYQNVQWLEEENYVSSRAKEKASPRNTKDYTDKWLLTHAVWTSDGKNLSQEIVTQMQAAKGCGPDNFRVIQAAKQQNPPREQMTAELAIMFATAQTDTILWQLMFELGLGKALLDFMAPSATPEEKEWANHQITKAKETIAELGFYLGTKEQAKHLGITFKEAALKKAQELVETSASPE